MALNLGAQKIYTFFSQPVPSVVSALDNFVFQKEKHELFNEGFREIYDVAEVLKKKLNEPTGYKAMFDSGTIALINEDLLKAYISNPSDKELLSVLASQILMVASASDTAEMMKNIKPYDEEDMQLILQGKFEFYDDGVFVYSLRKMLDETNVSAQLISKLLNSLPPAPKEEEYADEKHFWLDCLIKKMMLQLVWKNFDVLSTSDQKFLIQNYFYISMVMGIPVNELLQKIDDQEVYANILKLLEYNYEIIPLSAEGSFGIGLIETMHEFNSISYQEKINTFAKEKFIKSFYEGEEKTEAMQNWLRQLLTVFVTLRSKIK